MEPIVSVVVPVYNAEKFLRKCLDSIVGQTVKNLEIICVDDGSSDSSYSILQEYASRDDRFVLVQKKNEGLVAARKTGIALASAKYLGYVDADDWIEPEMYEYLLDKMNRYSCDFATSGMIRQFGEREIVVENEVPEGYYSGKDYEKQICCKMLYNGVYYRMGIRLNLVNKLFVTEQFRTIQMGVPDIITNGEDAAAFCAYASRSKSCWLTNMAFYHYRQHPASITKKTEKYDLAFQRAQKLFLFLNKYFKENKSRDILQRQLRMYISNILVQKCITVYDINIQNSNVKNGIQKDKDQSYLQSYGGIEAKDRVAVYGAGNFGRQVYANVCKICGACCWVDKNAEFYQSSGMKVEHPEYLLQYDPKIILLAVIDEVISMEIKKNLINMGMCEERIRWLDVDYITSEEILNRMGLF